MARKPMVTRTFTTTLYSCIAMDMNTLQATEVQVSMARVLDNKDKMEKAIREEVAKLGVTFVAIKEVSTVEKLLGMSEQDFLKYAVELDQETRRPIGEEDDQESTEE